MPLWRDILEKRLSNRFVPWLLETSQPSIVNKDKATIDAHCEYVILLPYVRLYIKRMGRGLVYTYLGVGLCVARSFDNGQCEGL